METADLAIKVELYLFSLFMVWVLGILTDYRIIDRSFDALKFKIELLVIISRWVYVENEP